MEGVELSSLSVVGVLCITNAGLVFRSDKTHLRVFHGMVAKADTKRKKKAGGSTFGHELTLQIDCKVRGFSVFYVVFVLKRIQDLESYTFGLPKQTPKNLLETLLMLAFPRETRQLYAFSYQLPPSVSPDPAMPDGWVRE